MRLLERYGVETAGRRAVVVGRSTLVGLPLSLLLARKGVDATVTMAHSRTADLAAVCREADILVGRRRAGPHDHRRPRQARRGGHRRRRVAHRRPASSATSTRRRSPRSPAGSRRCPGGTGPMTIACLMENTVTAARLQGVDV